MTDLHGRQAATPAATAGEMPEYPPPQFRNRWGDNRTRTSFDDTVCWHLLLGDSPGAQAAAAEARERLAGFDKLHLTPVELLHISIQLIGPPAGITTAQTGALLSEARAALSRIPAASITLKDVLYHPEAIAAFAFPADALMPILTAARDATRAVLGIEPDPGDIERQYGWIPHMTLAYSAASQPTKPVIDALGTTLSPQQVTITELSLVIQNGPEQNWDWQVTGTARLGR